MFFGLESLSPKILILSMMKGWAEHMCLVDVIYEVV